MYTDLPNINSFILYLINKQWINALFYLAIHTFQH